MKCAEEKHKYHWVLLIIVFANNGKNHSSLAPQMLLLKYCESINNEKNSI